MKPRKPQDLTLRNLHAMNTRLAKAVAKLEARLNLIDNNVRMVRQRVKRMELEG